MISELSEVIWETVKPEGVETNEHECRDDGDDDGFFDKIENGDENQGGDGKQNQFQGGNGNTPIVSPFAHKNRDAARKIGQGEKNNGEGEESGEKFS